MKVAVITDIHFGVRNDAQVMLDYQELFFEKIFIPYLVEHDIKQIFDLGDILHRRKYANFLTLERARSMFFDRIEELGVKVVSILGNHDTYYKNTNDVNCRDLVFDSYKNVHTITKLPEELTFGSTKVLFVPWIAQDNYAACIEAMMTSDAPVMMGHFAFSGVEMIRGVKSDHGLNLSDFSRYEGVYSGHFHHQSTNGNVVYLGAPFEMDWSDHGCKRGFHVFDTETRAMEFVQNPFSLFHKIDYDDSNMSLDDINGMDFSVYKNTFVKVVVGVKTNAYLFDIFVSKLSSAEPFDLKVIDMKIDLTNLETEEAALENMDTRKLIHNYIDNLDISSNKDNVKKILDSVYAEALQL